MKKILSSLILLLSIIIVSIISYRPISREFKEIQHFNYNNVDNITIKFEGYDKIKIKNPDDIYKIIEYLNSLELIEEELPKNEQANYEGDWEKYKNDLKNICHFSISVNEDVLYFSTKYVVVMVDGCDDSSHQNSYFIKNSGYDKKKKTSNIYTFLKSITEKYV